MGDDVLKLNRKLDILLNSKKIYDDKLEQLLKSSDDGWGAVSNVATVIDIILVAPEIAKIIAAALGIEKTIFGDPAEDVSWGYVFEKLNEEITNDAGTLDTVEALKFTIEVLELNFAGTAELFGVSNIVAPIVDLWDTNIIQPVISKLTDVRDNIYNTWDTVAEWFSENVVGPIAALLGGLRVRVQQIFEGIRIIILAVWTSIVVLFEPVTEKIKEIWEELCIWFETNFVEPIEKILGKLSDFVEITLTLVLNAVISDVESALNFLIGQVNVLLEGFNEIVSWAAKIAKVDWEGVELIPEISIPRISWYKTGGILPDNYTLIGAGENGVPEIMCTVGGRAAIAGGVEITGIRDEIRATADEEISLLKEQNMLLQAILEKEFGVTTDVIGKSAKKYAQDYYMRTGKAAYVY